ncbi:metal ABC transporter substrate-binding protein [Lentzea sp. NBRC 105346]|uniref:metal ABC transporter solute-binding protein, Zn/Mn family n=1 Tax=Lentzea sp. NBRC 105346 TaxID=3032205 RepID=UPI0024A52E59|nr:zinc ABC transporter substrate-binding protein [Lentzea sp. NBRC 105346]GLZ32878.1 metal ABC transporter substrate-binding protein [Lentzea sp. NBRC 105346]
MTLRNALVALLAAVSLTACGTGATTTDNGKIKVAASTNVWGSVVKAVGGDDVEVTSIINDPSADPHSYESKPADVAAVQQAKLVVFNGGGYDDFFAKLIQSDDAKKIEAFPLSGLADAHKEGSEEHAEANEHVWYDLPSVKKVADQAAQDLAAIAPDKKATFEANAKDFGAKLDALLERVQKLKHGQNVMATEPVAHYLLEAAAAHDVTPVQFSKAVEQETDVPAAALAEAKQLVENKQIVALVNNSQTENPVAKQLVDDAKGKGIAIVTVSETLPEGVTGYVVWMTQQVDALANALGK